MLYLVPTPIGNLKDFTFRAIEVLKSVEQILTEDTRHSGKLLKHYDINTPMRSFHAHNEHGIIDQILNQLIVGKDLALITDAGTPGISDPGFLLVRACREKGIAVTCLPGATAFVPAMVASGIPCDRFFFEGFLPVKKGRKTRLQKLVAMDVTIILYESPYRLLKTLGDILTFFGTQSVVSVSKEISKVYEEVITGPIEDIIENYSSRSSIKGEFVIVISRSLAKNN